LTWAAPVTGGEVERYIIAVTDLAGTPIMRVDTGNPATTFSHSGAPPGTYLVAVHAANATGVGPSSTAVTVTVTP
jgi:hypothetical protein